MTRFIGAIDQGTTSTRFIIYNHRGEAVGSAQKEHRQIFPRPGWVKHDPLEIWENTATVIGQALESAGLGGQDLAAVGITNQRETTVVWEKLKVDGGMVVNELLMQFQADILDVPVIRPQVIETTALGVGFWADTDELRRNWSEDKRWTPDIDARRRERFYAGCQQAIKRTLGWA